MNLLNNYQIVVIDSAYAHIRENMLVQELFPKIIALKLNGYLKEYPYGVMPIDTTDFIGTHLLLCRWKNNHLEPIMGCKSITLSRCLLHQSNFPLIDLLENSLANEHKMYVQVLLDLAVKQKKEISYESSFTIFDPEENHNEEHRNLLKSLLTTMLISYHSEANTGFLFSLAVKKFKTDRLFKLWGHQQCSINGKVLPPINLRCLFGEPVDLYQNDCQWSFETRQLAHKYIDLWYNRISITPKNSKAA